MTADTFPPVFVINLEKSADRRADMSARLDPLHMGYTFFKAVNGHALDIETLPAYDKTRRRLYFGRDLLGGEIGCLLSHRAVYQHMVDNSIARAIVFEDDVLIEENFPQIIREILQSPVKWDVIRFLAYKKVQKIGRDIFALPTKPHALARIPTTSGGAYGYMLTHHAAQVFLRHMQKNWLPIDILHGYVWRTGLETFILRPSPVSAQLFNESTIGQVRFDKTSQLSGWQKVVYPFTRAWHKFSELVGKRVSYWLAWPRDALTRR
jgi:glycosyl transferase family 25